jgi:tetratricopeptide (TPR) repeat protein
VSGAALISAALLSMWTLTEAGESRQPVAQTPPAIPDRAVLLQRADDAQRAGRPAEAVPLLRLAAERYQSVRAYLELARLQSRGGDTKEALASLSAARAIAPNAEDVLSAYAELALTAKMPLTAVRTLQSLTHVYPTVPQYHYLLGVGLIAIGDMQSAVDSLAQADRLEPDQAPTLLALGRALNNRHLFVEARAALSSGLGLQPDSIDIVAALAEAEAGLSDYDDAAKHAQEALGRAPANATANLVNGIVLMEQQHYAEARDVLLKAAASDPDSLQVLHQLSLVCARLGDTAEARRYEDLYQEKVRVVDERIQALRGKTR